MKPAAEKSDTPSADRSGGGERHVRQNLPPVSVGFIPCENGPVTLATTRVPTDFRSHDAHRTHSFIHPSVPVFLSFS